MNLFHEDVQRDDIGPASYSEPSFIYLNRSARPAVVLIRQELETWFSRYPDAAKGNILRRFQSDDKIEHHSAFFELYIHELLIRLGHKVEIPHPEPGASPRRAPDFLATSQDGNRFYVEATLATNQSQQDVSGEKRLNQVYDALNGLDSPNFFISVKVHGAPAVPVPGRRLRHEVRQFLNSLDPDSCSEIIRHSGMRDVPFHKFDFQGWRINISPIPKSHKSRGRAGIRPLGILGPAEAQFVDDRTALKDSVTAKASHYGDLGIGLVVAVNAINQHLEMIDIMEALFGQESFTFSTNNGGAEELQMQRLLNGAWNGLKGPKNTRVSAVLVMSSLIPWTVAVSNPEVFHHPRAKHSIGDAFDVLTHYRLDAGKVVRREGICPKELFELPDGWPLQNESDDV
jgi:hypothetical protein